MGTLTIDLFSSLDGFGASDGWPGYWGKEGPELMAWLEQKLAEEHILVMGAGTYREMSQIDAEGDDPTFERMAEIRKVVVTGVSGRRPIFAGWPDLDLELVSSLTRDGRMQVLKYVPTLHPDESAKSAERDSR